ncbi:MAG TPA: RNA methyltransferase [Anaeromyxobacteraceae bacterium]|nr:RNA methyltransferase [Anaeromyxobacteraceae bacterium]
MPHERVFAACAPGLEPLLAAELRELGLEARPIPGGAEAEGEDAVAVACLGSRLADALSLRLYEGPERGLDRARAEARRRYGAEARPVARVRGAAATLSLDAAGAPLYKRGYRERIGAAPLRETVAAALLRFGGFDPARPLLDPMCGSGTVPIEAALIAAGRAPGAGRAFAFERWPGHDASRTAAVRARLEVRPRAPGAAIQASDRNAGALRLAQKNAAAAGVGAAIAFARADARGVTPPQGPGLCAVNPPFGVRIDEGAAEAWEALAALVPRLAGWTLALVAPERGWERSLPARPAAELPFVDGGLACKLLRYQL